MSKLLVFRLQDVYSAGRGWDSAKLKELNSIVKDSNKDAAVCILPVPEGFQDMFWDQLKTYFPDLPFFTECWNPGEGIRDGYHSTNFAEYCEALVKWLIANDYDGYTLVKAF